MKLNLTANDVTVGYKKGTFEVTLKNSKGNAIADKPVTINLNGEKYIAVTDSNGAASINLTLTPRNYTADVHTSSDYYNKAGNAEATITAKDDRTTAAITASGKTFYLQAIEKGSEYQVTIKDTNGNFLANKGITVTFNGKTYKSTTNQKGIAKVTLKATKTGSLKATVKFAGDDIYKAASKTATIKVTKEASKLTASKKTFKAKTKTKKYTVTLKSKSGKAIAKVKVTIKVKGKTYKATTNAKGKATFKITKLTKKGKYTAVVKFAGNKYFTGKTVKPKITIK